MQTTTPQPAASAIAAPKTLTIDALYVRNAVLLAGVREQARETLQEFVNSRPISTQLATAVFWAVDALDERICTRAEAIRKRGGLLHYGAPAFSA